jgi:hypothetical protein
MTDLVLYQSGGGAMLVHPRTGEALDPKEAATDELADMLDAAKGLEFDLRALKHEVWREVHRRFDEHARWTWEGNGWKLTGQSPDRVEYDGEGLYDALTALSFQGVITPEARDAAVETQTVYKPRAAGINKLKKLGGRVRATIERHARPVESERRVSVSRKGTP